MKNFFIIFCSFLIDFSMGAIVYFSNFDQIQKNQIFPSFKHLLTIYFIAHFLRLTSIILFSKSLGQKIWNLKWKGNFLEQRIQGFIRSMFEVLSYFLIIFELPRLIKKRTLPELISNCEISFSKKVESNSVVLTLFFTFLILISPFFYRLSPLSQSSLSFSKIKEYKLDSGADFSKFYEVKSNFFHFSSFSSFTNFTDGANGRFIVLPSFEIITKNKIKKIRPFVYLYDKNLETFGTLKIHRKVSLYRLLKKYSPLFDSYRSYSEINKFLSKDEQSFKRKIFSNKNDNKTLLDSTFADDQLLLFYDVFNLSPLTLPQYYLKKKINIFSYLYLRFKIYDLLNINHSTMRRLDTDLIKLGNNDFIRIKEIITNDQNDTKIRELMLPLKTNNFTIMELQWRNTIDGALSNHEFKKYFLTQSKWYFDYKDINKVNKVNKVNKDNDKLSFSKEFEAFSFMDKVFTKKISHKKILYFIKKYITFIKERHFEEDNKVLNSILLKVVNRLLIYCDLKQISREEETVKSLKDLRISLK